jgi:hypothetical protein
MSGHSLILGREQHRRDMRAALHDLQQRLGQCHNDPSVVRVVGTVGPAPSKEGRIRRNCSGTFPCFYTIFTFFALL